MLSCTDDIEQVKRFGGWKSDAVHAYLYADHSACPDRAKAMLRSLPVLHPPQRNRSQPPIVLEVNPYELLGISESAPPSKVERAYRKKSLQVHPVPDKMLGKPDSMARDLLRDEVTRAVISGILDDRRRAANRAGQDNTGASTGQGERAYVCPPGRLGTRPMTKSPIRPLGIAEPGRRHCPDFEPGHLLPCQGRSLQVHLVSPLLRGRRRPDLRVGQLRLHRRQRQRGVPTSAWGILQHLPVHHILPT